MLACPVNARKLKRSIPWILFLFVSGLVSCGDPGKPMASASVGPSPASSLDLVRMLDAIDDADGVRDKVIGKCVPCGLAMDGKPEHVSRLEGYSVKLCSSHCLRTFEADPAGALGALDQLEK